MLTDEELPPLPEFPGASTPVLREALQSIARDYARAVERAAYEAAAKVCESLENRVVSTHPARIEFDPYSFMARKCAGAIRSLMQEQPK
jgi:hypothetical protein